MSNKIKKIGSTMKLPKKKGPSRRKNTAGGKYNKR